MIHLSSFTAVRYRGINGLTLPKLAKANLITGANGIGKTALIEAMWLFTGRYNPTLIWNPNVQRSSSPPLDPISRVTEGELELHGVEGNSHHKLKYIFEKVNGGVVGNQIVDALKREHREMPPVTGVLSIFHDGELLKRDADDIYLTPAGVVLYPKPQPATERPISVIESRRFQHETQADYLQRYSNLVREGRKGDLLQAVNIVTNRIEDVEILTDENRESYMSMAMAGGKYLPLHDLGGGVVRLVRLLLSFTAAKNGIFYSDEIENGIHYSAQRNIWDSTRQWMKRWNVQLVATTHSAEMIDAAIDAFEDRPSDLAIHKLFRNEKKGQIDVGTFTGTALSGARDLNLEIR